MAGYRTGAKALVEAFRKAGVATIFGYPGGNVLDIFDELGKADFDFVLGRHEQGCVHMADGYARSSGRPGVVIVTSGPGLTNTITGLGAANMDGVPMVLVCGQVPLDQIGTDAFQEADTTGLTRGVSKHNFLVKSADEIPETVAQAFYIATHGKPGPVVIDIPRDCQRAKTSAKYPERVVMRSYHPEAAATVSQVNRAAKLINCAKRPVIYAGGGVIAAGASAELVELAHRMDAPVVTTMMGLGVIAADDPLAIGMAGEHGCAAANAAIAGADVIFALGVRFNDRVLSARGRLPGNAKVIQVDCDPSAIGKNFMPSLGIVADVAEFLTVAGGLIRQKKHPEWSKRLNAYRLAARRTATRGGRNGEQIPRAAILAAAQAAGDEAIAVTDVGQHQLWVAKYFPHRRARGFIASGGMGAMGFGIPAAIGAAIARPGCRVVAFVGDGGAQMTAGELMVAVERRLPIVFVVFVNRTLGLVRAMQKQECGGRFFATALSSPDFVALAKAYGLKGVKVSRRTELEGVMRRAVRSRVPTLVAVEVDQEVGL